MTLRRSVVMAAVTLGLAGAMGLGLAAPANAFAVPPVAPEPLMLSSELAALGTAAEGATAAGSGAIAAFAPVAPLAVAGIGFRIGFSMAGMVMAPFGISPKDDLCQITGGSNVPLNMVTNALTGADCSAQMTANTLTPDQQNSDQTATVTPAGIGSKSCTSSGACATMYAIVSYAGFKMYCLATDGVVGGYPVALYPTYSSGGTTWYAGSNYGASPATYGTATCPSSAGAVQYSRIGVTADATSYMSQWRANVNVPASQATTVAEPTATKPNPDRHYDCKITGSDGKTYTSSSAGFTQTDPNTAPLKCPTLPGGVLPTNAEVTLVTPGMADQVVVPEVGTTPAFQAAAAAYPECATASCHLQVWTEDGKNCSTVSTCVGWFTDPAKALNYECHYGTHVVDLAECNVMSNYYDPQKQASGQAYADPETGLDVPPATDPQTGVQTPVQTSPKTDEVVSNAPVQDPDEAPRECFPNGWAALNPINWVVQPVQCALSWAFVPRASVVKSDMDSIKNSGAGKAPAVLAAAIAGIQINAPGGGCGGITVPMIGPADSVHIGPFQILQACPGDMLAPVAMWSRIFGDLGFTVLGLVSVSRHLARVVQYGGLGSGGGES